MHGFTTGLQREFMQFPLAQSLPAKHAFPSRQRGQGVFPPQSTSVSPPFTIPSLHVGAGRHTPPLQRPLAQSLPLKHAFPSPHFGHVPPPQSMSLSDPFFIMSLQAGAATQTPSRQRLLAQSTFTAQRFPSVHFAHCGPPQSVSVSPPFFIMSLHDGGAAWQRPLVQTTLLQSLPLLHVRPSAQRGQTSIPNSGPPQSMSLSPPFLI
jgi:hypothetical protein